MDIERYYNCKEVIHMPIWEHKRSNSVILSYIKLRPTEGEIVLLLTLREESDGSITMSLQQWLSDHGLSGRSQALTDRNRAAIKFL